MHLSKHYQDPQLVTGIDQSESWRRTTLVKVRGKWHLVEMCEPILGLEDFEDEELDENSLVITFLTKEAGNPEDCGFKVESDQLIRPLEVKDFEVRSSSGNGGGEADGGERQVPEQEVKHVEMDPAVQEAGIVLREPFPESVVVNGVVLTEATKLRELRAACSFFGVGQSGSRRQCYQRIVSKLKEVELKAAAEVVANAQREVAREPRVQPVIPVPEEDEQERHRLVHTPYAPWCEFCIAHRAKQDRHLRSGNSKISSTPIISLDFCYTKAGTTVESNPGGEVRAEAAGGEVLSEAAVVEESSIPRAEEVKPALWMVMVCSQTGYLGAVPLKSKGQITLMAREIMTFCQNLGHDEVGFYGDNEPTV